MTYLPYIIGAYSIFALVLAWDGLSPLLRYRRVIRAILQKEARAAVKQDRRSA